MHLIKNIKVLSNEIEFNKLFQKILINASNTEFPNFDKFKLNLKGDDSTFKNYLTGYCNDKIFSGHTSLTLLLVLTIIKNKLINEKYNCVLIFYHFFYAILILATRNHYSVDVL